MASLPQFEQALLYWDTSTMSETTTETENVFIKAVDAYIKVGANFYDISSYRLTFTENAIPTLVVTVPPFQGNQTTRVAKNRVNITQMEVNGFSKLIEEYTYFSDIAKSKDVEARGCVFFAKLYNEQTSTEFQLNDWLLTGAGISSTATGSLELVLHISHPVVLLNETSINLLDTKSFTNITGLKEKVKEAENLDIVGGIIIAMTRYAEVYATSLDSKKDLELLKSYRQAIEYLGKYVKWSNKQVATVADSTVDTKINRTFATDALAPASSSGNWPSSLPIFKTLLRGDNDFKEALIDDVSPVQQQYLWQWLSSTLSKNWMFVLAPGKDTITMKPFSPWGAVFKTISTSALTGIDMNPAEVGVKGTYASIPSVINNVLTYAGGDTTKDVASFSRYIENNLGGAIIGVQYPSWLEYLLKPIFHVQTTAATPESKKTRANDDLANLKKFMEDQGFLKELFVEAYKQYDTIQLVLRPFLLLDYFMPSNVYKIQDAGSDKFIRFYATSIEHFMDCSSASGYTRINGQYVNYNNLSGVAAIPNGVVENSMYIPSAQTSEEKQISQGELARRAAYPQFYDN